MFNFSEWLVAGIIDGYKKGLTPFVKVTEMTAAYLSKGFITEAQAAEIAEACPAPIIEETEDVIDERIEEIMNETSTTVEETEEVTDEYNEEILEK